MSNQIPIKIYSLQFFRWWWSVPAYNPIIGPWGTKADTREEEKGKITDPIMTEKATAEATGEEMEKKAADRKQNGGEEDNVWPN